MNNPINFAYRLTSNLRSLRFVNPLCSVSVLSINKFSSFTSLKQAATSSSNARKPLYEKHIPTSPVQRGLLALGSAVITFSDLYRDDTLCVLGETTGESALRWIHQQMLNDPVGREILKDKPRISSKTLPPEELRKYPKNTFGFAYVNWLDTNRVTADTRRPVKFVDSAELAYVMTRYRECHDLMHVLIGSLPISTLGELVVKVFEARQTRLPMCALASIGGQYHLKQRELIDFYRVWLPWVLRQAARAPLLMNVYFEKHLREDMGELSARLNIEPPPYVIPRARYDPQKRAKENK